MRKCGDVARMPSAFGNFEKLRFCRCFFASTRIRAGTTTTICRKNEAAATNVAPPRCFLQVSRANLAPLRSGARWRGISVKDANFTKVITVTSNHYLAQTGQARK